MRKIPAALTVTALAALSLVACAPAGNPAANADCTRPAQNEAVAHAIDVSGAEGEIPEISLNQPFETERSIFADIARGDGPVIADLDQPGVVDMSLFSAETGEPIIGTSYSADAAPTRVSTWLTQFPGLEAALTCATAGTRTVVALSEDGVDEAARAQYAMQGFPAEGGVIAVVDVRDVYARAAWGSPVYNADAGVPSVVRTTEGRPGITVPDAEAPQELVVQTLLQGDGAEIGEGDTAIVQYTGVTWDDKTVFDSSWDSGALLRATGDGVIPGFWQAVEGQKVGSQVLAVIPPELGYGEQGSGRIPANSTLVFVIDIVGVEPAS
ncbi:FKBP-type peptidyl-prolyl cis-trans isomerase [Microbacterium sp. Marseille-Q6965]|uniref:FKBP-type peptidyl-prolyl cis-trans isomerase n=1 Tax=Microbacterium sp. Marseille-Q6965 TaxID=2965072 RepID=UPI0021B80983|nr:FKBP-type peptidyl-prolyl cis-trans isomerase [Microbacterium sp. Marseille-Q6965]